MTDGKTKVYEDIGNGVIVIDAEEYNRPFVEAARNMYYAFLITAVVVGVVFLFGVVFPFMMHTACASIPDGNVMCVNWR
jgi:high-affinity nickel permease